MLYTVKFNLGLQDCVRFLQIWSHYTELKNLLNNLALSWLIPIGTCGGVTTHNLYSIMLLQCNFQLLVNIELDL